MNKNYLNEKIPVNEVERKKMYGGYSVKKTKKGFLITWFSNVQREITDRKVLVYYNNEYTKNLSLTDKSTYNDFCNDIAEEIQMRAYDKQLNYKLLSKGYKVQ